jgi:hypothetical protein
VFSFLLSLFLVSSASAYLPNAKMPLCLDEQDVMDVDNARVLHMKYNTPNQFLARAFVEGMVVREPYRVGGHDRFVIQIGAKKSDTLEIIYNVSFGPLPRSVRIGDVVSVCGDYITSFKRGGGYEPSPEGALIHWVHYNPANRQGSLDHEHGFIMFGNDLAGFDDAPEAAWDGTIIRGGHRDQRNGGYQQKQGQQQRQNKNQQQQRRRVQGEQQRRPSQPARTGVCRTLSECRARNG